MNAKQLKKLRQYHRRDLRAKVYAAYLKLALLNKPWWLPAFVWRFGARFYFVDKVGDDLFNKNK